MQQKMKKKQDFHIIVSDGFGNKEETTTVYHVENGELKQIDKRKITLHLLVLCINMQLLSVE